MNSLLYSHMLSFFNLKTGGGIRVEKMNGSRLFKVVWDLGRQTGFFLIHYAALWRRHLSKLNALYKAGILKVGFRTASVVQDGIKGFGVPGPMGVCGMKFVMER